MILHGLIFENWMPFRGKHSIELQPKAYAITAQRTDDPKRSNYCGKSSVLEAIDFLFYGRLKKSRRSSADGWISRGEKFGSVTGLFDDGTSITRSRKMGQSTQIKFIPKGGAAKIQDAAQTAIVEMLGLGSEDFIAASYFEQRQMARFILADPGPRMAIVSEWIQLAPVEAAEAKAKEKLAEIMVKRASRASNIASLHELRATNLGNDSPESIREREKKLVVEIQDLAGQVGQLELELEQAAERTTKIRAATEYSTVIAEGQRLGAESEKMRPVAELKSNEAAAFETWEEAVRKNSGDVEDLRRKVSLVSGQFDGVCPVAGIACPAKDEILSRRAENDKAHKSALKKVEESEGDVRKAKTAYDGTRAAHQAKIRIEDRLVELRERAKKLQIDKKGNKEGPTSDQIRQQLTDTRGVLRRAELEVEALRRAVAAVEQIDASLERMKKEQEAEELRVRVLQIGMRAAGKNGAQRVLAEKALGTIEGDANARLARCKIDLTVKIRWGHEGKEAAKMCEQCGMPFPASTRIKICEFCGAPRGLNMVNKLDVELSDQSGAAEDLAGIAVQLSASDWLRRQRGSNWESIQIDEPFGQLDEANRIALSNHLNTLFIGGGTRQAFVVAHHSAMIDSLRGRIEILNDAGAASIRVVS